MSKNKKTLQKRIKKNAWPAFPEKEVVEALKAQYMNLEAVQAAMATELQAGNRWMAMAMCQFPDGAVATMTSWYVTQEESRAGRRAMQGFFEGGTLLLDAERAAGFGLGAAAVAGAEAMAAVKGRAPMRYLASWNFGMGDASKWMGALPEA